MNPELQADLAWCEDLVRRNASSFYLAFRDLTPPRNQAAYAVFAFCSAAGEADGEEQGLEGVALLADQLELFALGATPDEPLWRALRWAFQTFPLEIEPFRDLLDGQLQDADFRQPQNFSELLHTCYLISGTVGLMLSPLLVEKLTDGIRRLVIDLGTAMQLTNILRDVGVDYRQGRIYLPSEMLASYQVDPASLGGRKPTPGFRKLWEQIAAEAESRFSGVQREITSLEPEARLPVMLSLLYFGQILQKCRQNLDQLLDKPVVLPDWQKKLLFSQARLQVYLQSRRRR